MDEDSELQAVLTDHDRIAALHRSGLLDSPREPAFDNVTANVCEKLNVPISLVTIIDAKRQFFKSCVGLAPEIMEARQTPIEDSTCQYVVKKKSAVIIDDVEKDPFFRMHAGLKNVHAGAYLGVPLYQDSQVIGSVCAVDFQPRKWSESEIDFLEEKAEMLRSEVAKR